MKIPKIKLKEDDILPVSVAILTGSQVVQVLALLILAFSLYVLAKQPQPTLVQRNDGTAFVAESLPQNYREPEVIRQFVKDWATLQFTWSGKLPSTNGKSTIKDEGILVNASFANGEKQGSYDAKTFFENSATKVPTIAYQSAFLLPDFERQPFLQLLAKDWIPKDYFSSNPTTTVLNFDFVGEPQLIDRGRGIWQVDLLSTLNYFNDNAPVGAPRHLDRTLIIATVEPPKKPLLATASIYEQLVYQMRSRRLQILKILPSEVRSKKNVYPTPSNSN